ncbi:DUF5709 domain-containing protein [Actinotalea sp. AC32]|nr:DUF5709 domain-containing protein [Actinotalea sp. AC32]
MSTSDYGDTTATSPDPETAAEGDTNQLQQDDTLLDRGVDSILDEGYSPPEHPTGNRLETHLDQALGERLDDKLAQEEPEVWDAQDEPVAGARESDRAGRLAADEASATGEPTSSTMATDVGIAGSGATAEEAAVHVVDEDESGL